MKTKALFYGLGSLFAIAIVTLLVVVLRPPATPEGASMDAATATGASTTPPVDAPPSSKIIPRPPSPDPQASMAATPSATGTTTNRPNVTPEQRAAFDEAANRLKPVAQHYTQLEKEAKALEAEIQQGRSSGNLSPGQIADKQRDLEQHQREMAEIKQQIDTEFRKLQQIIKPK